MCIIAAVLLLISGVTHVSQLFVYERKGSVIGAAAFGVIYLVIGALLLGETRGALWAGAIAPAIGGLLGLYRFLVLHPNPFTIFHLIVDVIVVPICIYLLVSIGNVPR